VLLTKIGVASKAIFEICGPAVSSALV